MKTVYYLPDTAYQMTNSLWKRQKSKKCLCRKRDNNTTKPHAWESCPKISPDVGYETPKSND